MNEQLKIYLEAGIMTLAARNQRISYGALGQAAKKAGHKEQTTPDSMLGIKVCKLLRLDLQPMVCRQDGGYSPKTKAASDWYPRWVAKFGTAKANEMVRALRTIPVYTG